MKRVIAIAKVPCKDCTARVMGCHVTCRLYKQYQKENEKTKQRRKSYLLNKDNVVGSILRNYGRKR